jgi:hypothetical protein
LNSIREEKESQDTFYSDELISKFEDILEKVSAWHECTYSIKKNEPARICGCVNEFLKTKESEILDESFEIKYYRCISKQIIKKCTFD